MLYGANGIEKQKNSMAAEEHQLQVPSCPICLEDFTSKTCSKSDPEVIIETSCGHKFHGECLGSAIRSGTYVCSVCRSPLGEVTAAESKQLKKYVTMLRANIPREAVRQAMEVSGLSATVICNFFTGGLSSKYGIQMSDETTDNNHTVIEGEKYSKMLKVGMPEGAVRQKMISANLSPDAIEHFFVNYYKKDAATTTQPPDKVAESMLSESQSRVKTLNNITFST
jgi:hypothetical protein